MKARSHGVITRFIATFRDHKNIANANNHHRNVTRDRKYNNIINYNIIKSDNEFIALFPRRREIRNYLRLRKGHRPALENERVFTERGGINHKCQLFFTAINRLWTLSLFRYFLLVV